MLNQNNFAEVLWWLGSLQLFLQEKGEIEPNLAKTVLFGRNKQTKLQNFFF